MTPIEIENFIEKHQGKKMTFISYFKYHFLYEFIDEEGDRYIFDCGDTDGDIYRDDWRREETIRPLKGFLHDIFKCNNT